MTETKYPNTEDGVWDFPTKTEVDGVLDGSWSEAEEREIIGRVLYPYSAGELVPKVVAERETAGDIEIVEISGWHTDTRSSCYAVDCQHPKHMNDESMLAPVPHDHPDHDSSGEGPPCCNEWG